MSCGPFDTVAQSNIVDDLNNVLDLGCTRVSAMLV
jgi:hypothetical protein